MASAARSRRDAQATPLQHLARGTAPRCRQGYLRTRTFCATCRTAYIRLPAPQLKARICKHSAKISASAYAPSE